MSKQEADRVNISETRLETENGRSPLGEVRAGQSKSKDFGSYTWNSSHGEAALTLNEMTVVFYRAPHSGGGYDAYMTFSCLKTSDNRWSTISSDNGAGIPLFVRFLDANGGPLDQWDVPNIYVNCGDSRNPFFEKKVANPDIFDLIVSCELGQRSSGITLRGC